MNRRTVTLATLLFSLPVLLGATAKEVASIDGANLQRPTWSPDGSKLAFEANFHDKKVVELYQGDADARTWQRVRGARRSSSRLTSGFITGETGSRVVHELAWSSDGRLAFAASNDDQDYDLFVGDGGALAPDPAADGGPVWTPDATALIFTSARTGQGDLYRVPVDAPDAPERLTQTEGSAELDPALSADGAWLAYVGRSDGGEQVLIQPVGGGEARPVGDTKGAQSRPRFAPVGGQVAFYSADSAGRVDLWVADAAGSAPPRRVLSGVRPDLSGPSFTPDGLHLVVVRKDPRAIDPIALVEVASGKSKDLDFGTVNHGDLDVVYRDAAGTWTVAYVAQGLKGDPVRDFKRLYLATLDQPKP